MCKETRRKLATLPTKKGIMTTGAQEGFAIVLEELEKNNKTIVEIHNEVTTVKEEVVSLGQRQTAVETGLGEVLKVVNSIQAKLTTDKIEEKAAVMSAFQAFVSTKFGKVLLFLFIVSAGLAIAYVVDHATGVSQIVGAVK